MGRKSELRPEERREIVLMMVRGEAPTAELARRYGVSDPTLHRWREDFIQAGEAALAYGRGAKADSEAARVRELEKALEERDMVIGELTIANRILKKRADGFCRTKG